VLGNILDPCRNLPIGGRHDLRTVAEIDLVSVVLRRIVGSGHHHRGNAAEVSDAEGNHGRWQRSSRDQDLEPGTAHDLCGISGEDIGVAPRIEADDHFAARQIMIKKIGSEAGGCLADHDSIHPIGSWTERSPKSCRTELESFRECIDNLCQRLVISGIRCRQKIIQLLTGLWIWVLRAPICNRARKLDGEVRRA
jgi:hypothetical protein